MTDGKSFPQMQVLMGFIFLAAEAKIQWSRLSFVEFGRLKHRRCDTVMENDETGLD